MTRENPNYDGRNEEARSNSTAIPRLKILRVSLSLARVIDRGVREGSLSSRGVKKFLRHIPRLAMKTAAPATGAAKVLEAVDEGAFSHRGMQVQYTCFLLHR